MRILNFLFLILLLVTISTPTLAQQRQSVKMDHKRADKSMISKMSLTDKQKQEIKQIMLDKKEAMLPLKNQMAEQRTKLKTLTTGNSADFQAARKVIDKISSLMGQMMKQNLNAKQKMRNLLTDEQRLKFDSRQYSFKKHRQHKHTSRMRRHR